MKTSILCLLAILFCSISVQCQSDNSSAEQLQELIFDEQDRDDLQVAYFASGCFWCVEAIFESVDGVEEVISGYSGGNNREISYNLLPYDQTGHAESVAVFYHPETIAFPSLVDVYFNSQDPSQKNGQGPDCGSQYRSILFYQNDVEHQTILEKIKALENTGISVAAEVSPFSFFVVAEDYHQDFKKRNPNNAYIKLVSKPRMKKFKEKQNAQH